MIGMKTVPTLTALLAAAFSGPACNYEKLVGEKHEVSGDASPGGTAAPKPLAWGNAYGGAGYDRAMGIAFTPSGDLVAVGHFDGPLDLGGVQLAGNAHPAGFVAKLAREDGSPAWAHQMTSVAHPGYLGDHPSIAASAVAVDAASNVYVTGRMGGLARFDSLEVTSVAGEAFLAKYAPDGTVDWARSVSVDGLANLSPSVTVGEDGEVTIGGWTMEAPLPNQGYIARYGANGANLWTRRLLSPGHSTVVHSVAAAPDGDVVVSGAFESSLVVDGQTLLSVASARQSAFVLRLSSQGTLRWHYVFGSTKNTLGVGVALDSDGNIYVAGHAEGTITHGGRTEVLPDVGDAMFLLALNGDGQLRWWSAHRVRGATHGVAVSGDEVVTCGYTLSGDLGNGSVDAGKDLFVARYHRADGSYLGSEALPGGNGPAVDVAFGVAASQDGAIAAAAGVTAAAGAPLDGTGASVDEKNIGVLLFAAEDVE